MDDREGQQEEWAGGCCWSWGAGTHGQLATGAFQDELLPQPLPNLSASAFPLRHIAGGGSHAVAALRSGEALTWGNGNSGQLGHGDSKDLCEPTLVKELQSTKIRSVSAGWSHTAFISEDQALFTCGSGGFGQLGHGNFESCSVPKRVTGFALMKVSLAACGMRHTLVLVDSGKDSAVYAFGSSKRGQLGIKSPGEDLSESKRCLEAHHICHPHNIGSLNGCAISSVHANGDHSAALSECGDLYIWGRGYSTPDDILFPSKVSGELRFYQVALGWNHFLALTNDGLVYAAGRNRYGALNTIQNPTPNEHRDPNCSVTIDINAGLSRETEPGSSSQESEVWIDLFEPLKGSCVRWMATGSEHSAVVLDDGSVMTWGWGEHGQLGLGTTNDQSRPESVVSIPRMPNSQIFCGCGFTFVCKAR